jgi:hypothetical protein
MVLISHDSAEGSDQPIVRPDRMNQLVSRRRLNRLLAHQFGDLDTPMLAGLGGHLEVGRILPWWDLLPAGDLVTALTRERCGKFIGNAPFFDQLIGPVEKAGVVALLPACLLQDHPAINHRAVPCCRANLLSCHRPVRKIVLRTG